MGQIQRDGKANGVSTQVRFAITQGKAPSFFVIDGYDIMMVLSEANNAISLMTPAIARVFSLA